MWRIFRDAKLVSDWILFSTIYRSPWVPYFLSLLQLPPLSQKFYIPVFLPQFLLFSGLPDHGPSAPIYARILIPERGFCPCPSPLALQSTAPDFRPHSRNSRNSRNARHCVRQVFPTSGILCQPRTPSSHLHKYLKVVSIDFVLRNLEITWYGTESVTTQVRFWKAPGEQDRETCLL